MKCRCEQATYVFKNERKIIQCNAEKSCFNSDFIMQVNENIVNIDLLKNNGKRVEFVCENNAAAIIFTEQLRDIICGDALMDVDLYDVECIFSKIKHGNFFCLETSKEKLLYYLKEKFKNNSLKNVMVGLTGGDISLVTMSTIIDDIENTFIDNNGNAVFTIYGDCMDADMPEDMIQISFWYDEDDLL